MERNTRKGSGVAAEEIEPNPCRSTGAASILISCVWCVSWFSSSKVRARAEFVGCVASSTHAAGRETRGPGQRQGEFCFHNTEERVNHEWTRIDTNGSHCGGAAMATDRGCPQPQQPRKFDCVRSCLMRLSVHTRCGSGDPRSIVARRIRVVWQVQARSTAVAPVFRLHTHTKPPPPPDLSTKWKKFNHEWTRIHTNV